MKKPSTIIWIIVFLSMTIPGRSSIFLEYADVQKEISDAIRAGNVTALARYFNATIDLSLPGNESTYNKAQAELVMKDFFQKNPPLSFTINHTGSSKDGSLFFIGTYVTTQQKSYRTYYLVKKSGEKYLIQQLQFEPD